MEFGGWINECNGNPGYVVGLLEAALEHAGSKNVKITVSNFDGHSANLNITTWRSAIGPPPSSTAPRDRAGRRYRARPSRARRTRSLGPIPASVP